MTTRVQLIPDDPKWEIVEFDLTQTENHKGEGELTSNPVEDGTTVSDHLVRPPQTVSLSVCISNAPTGPTLDKQGAGPVTMPLVYPVQPPTPQIALSLFGVSLSLDFGPKGSVLPLSVTGSGMPQNWDRIRRHLELLDRMRDAAVVLSVATLRRYYTSMVLESWTHDVEGPITVGVFMLSFKRLRVVQTLTVDTPQPKEPRGAGGQAKGSQATTPAAAPDTPEQEKAKKTSLAKKLLKYGEEVLGG